MLDLAGQELDRQKMDELVGSMFRQAGLTSKRELSFDDFQLLLRDYKDELNYATLQFDGKHVALFCVNRFNDEAKIKN